MGRRLTITAMAILVFVAALVLKQMQRQEGESTAVTSSETATALPRLVDLGSDKCIPCKKMAPILEELSAEHRGEMIVEIIDVRKDPSAAKQWSIRVIPTQIFIDAAGHERFRHEGFMAKAAILAKWKELGVELNDAVTATGA